jgi:hypothetical protein
MIMQHIHPKLLLERKWFQTLAFAIIISAALVSFYYFYLALWPIHLIDVVQPYKVLTPIVKAGTLLQYETQYCSKTDETFEVNRSILNIQTNEVTQVANRFVHIPKGSCTKETVTIAIPPETILGRYKLLASVEIQANPIRRIVEHYESEEFQIIANAQPSKNNNTQPK